MYIKKLSPPPVVCILSIFQSFLYFTFVFLIHFISYRPLMFNTITFIFFFSPFWILGFMVLQKIFPHFIIIFKNLVLLWFQIFTVKYLQYLESHGHFTKTHKIVVSHHKGIATKQGIRSQKCGHNAGSDTLLLVLVSICKMGCHGLNHAPSSQSIC